MRRDDASSWCFVIRECCEGARARIWNTNEREITPMVMPSLFVGFVSQYELSVKEKKCGFIERV
jgi:hypothetical protein